MRPWWARQKSWFGEAEKTGKGISGSGNERVESKDNEDPTTWLVWCGLCWGAKGFTQSSDLPHDSSSWYPRSYFQSGPPVMQGLHPVMDRNMSIFFFFFLLFSRKKIKGKSQKSHGTNMSLEIRISGFCFQFQSFLLWKCNSWNGWTSSEFISAKGENKYNHLSQHTHIHTHTHPILNMQIVGSMIPSFQNTDFGNESALDCPASLLHFGAISQLMLC